MKYYKFLTADNKGEYSNFDYTEYLPDGDQPGKWLPKIETLSICNRGYHACKAEHLLSWVNARLYEVELVGDIIDDDNKTVAQQMRIVKKVETWNTKTVRLFVCYCARDVLAIYEKDYPDDKRPRIAIETSERFAEGNATPEELAVARDAARDAARDVARDVARDAAKATALDVAWAAVMAITWESAWALASARDVAWVSATYAARDAARIAELDKYTKHLIEMLGL